ncbi:hypothetical protein OS493_039835 [Desmophyllum pertusum]|uniref:Uncharacterized protein n=1 Tax=Desmophyllum pertusum TaxID=174260 RepID=A0A9W9Y6X4_9CNID|nr:hypothetical protein OS493_039835 [Desmophyllum pertusum]
MVRNDKSVFRAIKRLVQNRNHQNLTSWSVYAAAVAAHGKYEAQNVLAQAVKTGNPRPLTSEEYETLLISIFYLPDGPLHSSLFNALLELTIEDGKGEDVTATAMLVLAALTERAKRAGYNDSLSDSVADMIHHRYRNRSSLYHPESIEYESHLRDHIWAFGNLGHHSGLPIILEHIDHDNSDIRSSVISAMRKLPPKHTDQHLMKTLYQDEHSEVKTAVVNVFIDRHQNLTESVVQGLEHALWHTDKDETLDSSIQEFLENHGNHTKAVYLRTKRSVIHRRKRAFIPELRPREYELGQSQRWGMGVGGEWLGAETAIQFMNKLQLRVGIFGGKFEINLDNYAILQAHILKFPFEIAKGKAAFKASASFKNDFPKDLIHTVVDFGDELLRKFDSITSVITKTIEKFRTKLVGKVPASQQTAKIKEYFMTLGSSVPEGFGMHLPFKISIHFSLSLEKFHEVLLRLQRFSNNYLEMSYLLDSLDSTQLPTLSLPFLKLHSPTFQRRRFNFGLGLEGVAGILSILRLKSQNAQNLANLTVKSQN